jgi:hypothetical protein
MKEKKTNRFTSFDSNEKKRWNGWRENETITGEKRDVKNTRKKLNGGFSSHHSRQAI